MSEITDHSSEMASTKPTLRVQDNYQNATIASKTKPPVPVWRLIPRKIPMDVQICALLACLTACVLILSIGLADILPEPNPDKGIIQLAWTTAFWTYLGGCLHFADMAVDRQARYELDLQKQLVQVEDKDQEIALHTEQIQSTVLGSEPKASLAQSQPQSSSTHTSDGQLRQRNGWRARDFKAAILFHTNPQRYSSMQLIRRATITCILMIEGSVILPVVIYLGQKLFLPEDEVEDMAANIPSWSLLFWCFSLLGISRYGFVLGRRREMEEQKGRENVQQIAHQSIAATHDGEIGQCG